MKKGFTLVELSIVLVVVGLLIGGILVGQGMVETLKLHKLGQEMIAYRTFAVQFKEKFRRWPGDDHPACLSSKLNGKIGHHASTDYVSCASNESGQFWLDLVNYGYIKGDYAAVYYPGSYPGRNMLIDYFDDAETTLHSSTQNPGLIVLYSGYATGTTAPGPSYKLYGIDRNGIRTSSGWWGIGFTDVYENIIIDKKFDDNHPGTGEISTSAYNFLNCVDGNNTMRKEEITWDLTTRTDQENCIIHVWLPEY